MQLTGKDLVLLIINNNLLDVVLEDISIDDTIFFTVEEAAVKLGISTNSLLDMYKLGLIPGFDLGEKIYFDKDIDLSSIKRRNYE